MIDLIFRDVIQSGGCYLEMSFQEIQNYVPFILTLDPVGTKICRKFLLKIVEEELILQVSENNPKSQSFNIRIRIISSNSIHHFKYANESYVWSFSIVRIHVCHLFETFRSIKETWRKFFWNLYPNEGSKTRKRY